MESIKAAKVYLREISAVVKPSFGPNGKYVLLKSVTGVTYITKNGLSVVRQIDVKHPIARLIKDTVESTTESIGDFSKCFFLIMESFISALENHYMSSITRAERMHSVLSMISATLVHIKTILARDTVRSYLIRNGCLWKVSPDAFLEKYLHHLFAVVSCGQFNTETLGVMKQIIKTSLSFLKLTEANLLFIIEKYQQVCINVYGVPFNQSKVVEGIIIQREPSPQRVDLENCRFILIAGNMARSSSINLELSLSGNTITTQLEETSKRFYDHLVGILVTQKINVIFCEEKLPSLFSSLLQAKGIVCVSFVPERDLDWMCMAFNISTSGIYHLLNVQDFSAIVGVAGFMKSCVLGTHICCHLGPPFQKRGGKPCFHIILCSLCEGIGTKYSEGILNFFRTLYQAFDENLEIFSFGVVPSCGCFEILLSKFCSNDGEFSSHLMDGNSDIKQILDLFAKSLLVVPKCILENSNKSNGDRLILDFREITFPLGVDGYTGGLMSLEKERLCEPFNSKIKLISSILELSSQIFRIEMVVPITKKQVKNSLAEEYNDDY